MTRTSAAGHPLHQAVSFLFLFLLLFWLSLISLLFLRQCFSFFFIAFFVPFCNFCFSPPFVLFHLSLFLTFFFPPFLKLLLFWLFFFDLFLLFCYFLTLSFLSSIFELLCKNLSLLLFISCFFFRFLCFSVFCLSFVLLFFVVYMILWTSSCQNRLPLSVCLFLVFSTPCFVPFVLTPLFFLRNNHRCLSSLLFISGPLPRSSFSFSYHKTFLSFSFRSLVCFFVNKKLPFLLHCCIFYFDHFLDTIFCFFVSFSFSFFFLRVFFTLLFAFHISFYCLCFFSFFLFHFSLSFSSCSFHFFFCFSFLSVSSFDITLHLLCFSLSIVFVSLSSSLFCLFISFFVFKKHVALLPSLTLSILLAFLDLHHLFFFFIAFSWTHF